VFTKSINEDPRTGLVHRTRRRSRFKKLNGEWKARPWACNGGRQANLDEYGKTLLLRLGGYIAAASAGRRCRRRPLVTVQCSVRPDDLTSVREEFPPCRLQLFPFKFVSRVSDDKFHLVRKYCQEDDFFANLGDRWDSKQEKMNM
jgi:hypothetical protein